MDLNRTIYNIFTGGASEGAIKEGIYSKMPGRDDGPADAYRHITLAGELTRRYGEELARKILDLHEWTGNLGDQSPEAEAMDRHNNDIGIRIGRDATSWREIIQKARQEIDSGGITGDHGRWLPESEWDNNPLDDDTPDPDDRIPTGDPRLNWPNPTWPENNLPYPENKYDPKDGNDRNGDFDNGDIGGDPFSGLPWPGIDPRTGDYFNKAQHPPRKDPLTLDLDNDGIETVAVTSGILFDHDGDGIKTATGWVKSDDGFLALDRNGNGTIDNGTELFGDATPANEGITMSHPKGKMFDGFDALKQEDTNHDGKVDNQDANWSQLRVWRDLNQDGISQANELFTLGQLGISSFNVAKTENNQTLANGNQIADLGTFTKSDGSTGAMGDVAKMGDVNLAEDTFHREFPDQIPLADGVALLPEMQGSGKVRDLHEAASQSEVLKGLLTAFSAATTRQEQVALLDQILGAWADTSGMIPTLLPRLQEEFGSKIGNFGTDVAVGYEQFGDVKASDYINYSSVPFTTTAEWDQIVVKWEHKIHTLEAFNGRYFIDFDSSSGESTGAQGMSSSSGGGGSGGTASNLVAFTVSLTQQQVDFLDHSYGALRESVYSSLVLQTRLKPLFDQIKLVIDDTGIRLDFSTLEQHFRDRMSTDKLNGLADLIEFNSYAGGMLQDTGWHGGDMVSEAIQDLPLTPEILSFYSSLGSSHSLQDGTASNDVVLGGYDSDHLYGNGGDDLLSGGEGHDVIYGGAGNDILIGGAGSDTLVGDAGSDTYVFGRGAGQDTISNSDAGTGKTDTLLLTGVLPGEVTLGRAGVDLLVSINGTADVVRLSYYLQNDGDSAYKVEQIKFDDGTIWDVATVKAKLLVGTAANETISGYASDDTLTGGAGNDALYGNAGNDVLNGGDGNDVLYGGAGNDILIGGAGSDTLMGEAGSDIFKLIAPNQGIDSISDFASGVDSIHIVADSFGLTVGVGVTLLSGSITPSALGASPQFLYNTVTGALYFDRDGAGSSYGAVQIATLTGQKTLVATDIVVDVM